MNAAVIDNAASATLAQEIIEQHGTRVLCVSPRANADTNLDAHWPEVAALLGRARHVQGGVLLRGFEAPGADGFGQVAARLGEPLLDYEFGSTPRKRIEKRVYSSTEYPADQWIDQHNEQSYTTHWPSTIWFYCEIAAQQGGATPIADSRLVHARLDPALRRRFAEQGVMYVRNYGNGLDLPWQQVFGTEDRTEVERYCATHRIGWEWLDDGEALRTRQVCQSELRHPVTGETVWFNQAHLFHVTNLPDAVREALLDVVDEDRLPRQTLFGDGSPIPDAMLDEIRSVYRESLLAFDWRAADLLMLDNLLMSHGRAPFAGPRRVLVAMSGPPA
jgi:alpha-ketoglutarate-dependent taurine dioxygenase